MSDRKKRFATLIGDLYRSACLALYNHIGRAKKAIVLFFAAR